MSARRQVSVVVIGRNEGARLSRCLESVRAARQESFALSLMYVDSASSDDSIERARACGAQVIALNLARPCAAAARNAGWQAAGGEFVLFLDGDTVLHPEFIERALWQMSEPRVVVVWGHRRECWPQQSVYVRVLDLDWIYAPGDTRYCGGDALMRRAALCEVGGFDASLIAGEEPELCSRLIAAGGVIRHIDAPMTLHDLAIRDFRGYWRRAFRAGHAYAEVADRCRQRPGALWAKQVRRNTAHGALVAAAPLALVAGAMAGPAWLATLAALVAMAVARSVRRCAWKSESVATRVLYALHSHAQKLPIVCGQIAYRLDRRAGRRRGLIDYKEGAT